MELQIELYSLVQVPKWNMLQKYGSVREYANVSGMKSGIGTGMKSEMKYGSMFAAEQELRQKLGQNLY